MHLQLKVHVHVYSENVRDMNDFFLEFVPEILRPWSQPKIS